MDPLMALYFVLCFQVGEAFLPGGGSRLLDLGSAESGVEMAGGLWSAGPFVPVQGLSLGEIRRMYLGVLDDAIEQDHHASLHHVPADQTMDLPPAAFDWRNTSRCGCVGLCANLINIGGLFCFCVIARPLAQTYHFHTYHFRLPPQP